MNSSASRTPSPPLPTGKLARRGIVCAIFAAALLGSAAPANAAVEDKPASASACLATWYANRTFGNVGEDTRYFARLSPGEVGDFSSTFAKVHAGTVEACLAALGG